MRARRPSAVLLLAASTFGCAAPAPVTYAQGGPFQRAAPAPASANLTSRLLAAHNIERARVGAPPLRWDAALAAAAAAYGPTLSRLGRLEHSARASRPGQRENLWMGSRGRYSPEQMVGSWASERQWFRPGTFPNVSSTGNWLDVSHYTQMIWRTTTNVGCAVHSDARMDYLICRYSPPGNVDGRRVP